MHRFAIFRDNLNIVRSSSSAHQMGVTEFADWTNAEFRDKMLMPVPMNMASFATGETAPTAAKAGATEFVDWRLNGSVTDVRNSAPWTDAAITAVVEALEAQYAQQHGQLIRLSTQQLVECMYPGDKSTVIEIYKYLMGDDSEGLASEADYPEREPSFCQFDKSKSVGSSSGYLWIPGGRDDSEEKVRDEVETDGPVVAVIDARDPAFQMYKSGIYSSETCEQSSPNHAVLIIGYGTEAGQAYWLVKNSWGKGWGEEGYFRIARNKGNMCGISSECTRPSLSD